DDCPPPSARRVADRGSAGVEGARQRREGLAGFLQLPAEPATERGRGHTGERPAPAEEGPEGREPGEDGGPEPRGSVGDQRSGFGWLRALWQPAVHAGQD